MAVEVIAGLRSDEVKEVNSAAEDALHSLTSELHQPRQYSKPHPQGSGQPLQTLSQRNEQHTEDRQGLMDILEERIFALTTQLPRVCRQQGC